MRRLTLFVALALVVSCGGNGGNSGNAGDNLGNGVPDRSRTVPTDVRSFLDRIADPTKVAFRATYRLLTKNGGAEHVIDVTSTPPTIRVTIDGDTVDLANDASLSAYGIFSGFLSTNPAAAIRATARRTDADDAVHSTRTSAGVPLTCLAVPVQGAVTTETCITTDGIVGYVDNPTARYELTAYART